MPCTSFVCKWSSSKPCSIEPQALANALSRGEGIIDGEVRKKNDVDQLFPKQKEGGLFARRVVGLGGRSVFAAVPDT
jgi:hypothetical protein